LESQLRLAQADGQFSPRRNVFVNNEHRIIGMVFGLVWRKEVSHHFDVTIRVSRVRVSVRIRARFSFSDRGGIGLSDIK